MATLAKVVPIPKGNYSASATYNSLDIVRYNGKSWMCKQDSVTGITPAESAYWMLVVQVHGFQFYWNKPTPYISPMFRERPQNGL